MGICPAETTEDTLRISFFQRDSIEEGAMSDHLFVGWAGTKESAVGCFNWNRCLFFADEKFILKDYT